MGCYPSVFFYPNLVDDAPSSTSHISGVFRRLSFRNKRLNRQPSEPDRPCATQKRSSWAERERKRKQDRPLTEKQKKVVAKTMYSIRSKLSDLGIRVFLNIFIIKPEIRQLFPFRDKKDEELITDPAFRAHAARFMAVVDLAIARLDNTKRTNDLWRSLGAKHLHVQGFHPCNFAVFRDALLGCVCDLLGGEDQFRGEQYDAWDAVVRHIIIHLEQGYEQAKAKATTQAADVTEQSADVTSKGSRQQTGC